MAFSAVALGFMDSTDAKNGAWLCTHWGMILVVSSLMTLWGTIQSWRNEPTIDQLERDKRRLEGELYEARISYRGTMKETLRFLAGALNFGNSERISVYRHRGEVFFMLGRFSSNPNFMKRGRGQYPDNEGCIGRAWSNGVFHHVFSDPATNPDEYYKEHAQFGVKKAIVKKFNMKVRCIFGYAIHEPTNDTRIAVIVFESTSLDAIDPAVIEARMKDFESTRIAHLLERLHALEPDPNDATQEGF